MTSTRTVAMIGFGSLVRQPGPDLDLSIQRSEGYRWRTSGPILPASLSRVSRSRNGALTLVLDSDPTTGSWIQTYVARLQVANLNQAIRLLRQREGTTANNIGYVNLVRGTSGGRSPTIIQWVTDWAQTQGYQFVIWTDLPSNFTAVTGRPVTITDLVEHAQQHPVAQADYLALIPSSITTPELQALGH